MRKQRPKTIFREQRFPNSLSVVFSAGLAKVFQNHFRLSPIRFLLRRIIHISEQVSELDELEF